MKKYVIGFAFTENLDEVVLIRKNRPEWQAGKLNGVGGKVEEGESFSSAIGREFEEETGVLRENQSWKLIATMGDNHDYKLFIFAAQGDWAMDATTTTDENVARYNVMDLIESSFDIDPAAIYNVPWLILMARQMLLGRDHAPYYSIEH